MMRKNVIKNGIFMLLLCVLFYSCRDDVSGSTDYDPSKPIVLDSFSPESGGMATPMILSGSNLGNDPAAVKVYFNGKKAPVVGCDKGKVLVITPRQPGDICTISVVIGKDSVAYPNKFIYRTTAVVTTLVGQKGTTAFQPGAFSEATFISPAFLAVDNEYNLFLSHWGTNSNNIVFISQQNRTVTELVASGKANAPSVDVTGNIIMVPLDAADGYYMFDPDDQWAPRKRMIIHPSASEQAAGKVDFLINYKHGFAVCKLDSMIYTRANRNGQIVKFDPFTRVGQLAGIVIPSTTDSYLAFDPSHPNMLYISATNLHCIYSYDVLTKVSKVYAGTMGSAGWKDGKSTDAQFSSPRQMIFDSNNNMIIADAGNHCIRQITPAGMVSTVVGIAGKAGYQDGNPDNALFNSPYGIAIDKDYNIYIADYGNNCIRKLAIQ